MSRRDLWAGIVSGPIAGPAPRRPTSPDGPRAPGGRARHRGAAGPRIPASVRSFVDLAPALVGAVEQPVDFVTEPA